MKELKLLQMSKVQLEKRELKDLKGGSGCSCACAYAGPKGCPGDGMYGGSSTRDNACANADEKFPI